MTHMDLGQRGAKRQSWQRANPRAVLEALYRKHPDASEEELAAKFWDEIRSDDDVLKVIALDYWFPNNYRSMIVPPASPPRTRMRVAAAAVQKQVEAGIQKQARLLLMDLLMPNGKTLSECTGRDCQRFGGWLKKISTRVKPRQKVGDVLTETDLQSMHLG